MYFSKPQKIFSKAGYEMHNFLKFKVIELRYRVLKYKVEIEQLKVPRLNIRT